jgi:hypothetical protein
LPPLIPPLLVPLLLVPALPDAPAALAPPAPVTEPPAPLAVPAAAPALEPGVGADEHAPSALTIAKIAHASHLALMDRKVATDVPPSI